MAFVLLDMLAEKFIASLQERVSKFIFPLSNLSRRI